jgi:hypothetical protein
MEFLSYAILNMWTIVATPRDGISGNQFDKRVVFFSMKFTVPSTGGFYRKPILYSGF